MHVSANHTKGTSLIFLLCHVSWKGSSVIAAVTIPKASSVVAKSVRLCEQGCARMEWLQRLEFMVDISLYIYIIKIN